MQEIAVNREPEGKKVSDDAIRNLVKGYYIEWRSSGDRGTWLTEDSGRDYGRKIALEGILNRLGQKHLIDEFPKHFGEVSGYDTGKVHIEPIPRLTREDMNAFLLDYKHLYLLQLQYANQEEQRAGAVKFANKLQKWYLRGVLGGDPTEYKAGMVKGEFSELQTFLMMMECRLDMDQIQQNAERLYRRDPNSVREMLADKEKWRGVLKIDESVKGDWLVRIFNIG